MRKRLSWITSLLISVFVAGTDLPCQVTGQSINGDRSASTTGLPVARFDIATIKRSGPNQQNVNTLLTYPGARIEALGATFEYFLMEAYDLPPAQILGGPKWIHDARFDIEAKPSADVASRYPQMGNPKNSPPDEVREMLRNLLADRFSLMLHLQQTLGKVYLLTRNKGPLRLDPPKNDKAYPWSGNDDGGYPTGEGLRGISESMPDLTSRLSCWLSQPVIDKTGLTGSYDFLAVLGSSENTVDMTFDDGIIESVREIGLNLDKGTGLVETLVIDRASMPSDN